MHYSLTTDVGRKLVQSKKFNFTVFWHSNHSHPRSCNWPKYFSYLLILDKRLSICIASSVRGNFFDWISWIDFHNVLLSNCKEFRFTFENELSATLAEMKRLWTIKAEQSLLFETFKRVEKQANVFLQLPWARSHYEYLKWFIAPELDALREGIDDFQTK